MSINLIGNALTTVGIRKPEQQQQEATSYSGRLWSKYTKTINNIEPTRFGSVNKAAQVAIAIAGFVPYIVVALGAAIADGADKTKQAAIEAYTALKNKLSKEEVVESEQVSWMNKKTIAAVALVALATGAYVYFTPAICNIGPEFGPGSAEGIESHRFFNNPLAG